MGQGSQQSLLGLSILPTSTDISIDLPRTTAIPQRLVKKILNRDFVDMSKLLPDSWRVDEMNTQLPNQKGGPLKTNFLFPFAYFSWSNIVSHGLYRNIKFCIRWRVRSCILCLRCVYYC